MLSRSSFKMLALLGSLLFLVACGGDDGDGSVLGECPPDSAAQQTQGQTVLAGCESCHSSTLSGTDRSSAPVGVDFDVDSVVSSRAEAIYEKVLGNFPTGTVMPPPPNPALSDSDAEALRVYLACLGQ